MATDTANTVPPYVDDCTRQPRRSVGRALWILGICATLASLVVLYFFPPSEHRFYPRCLLYSYTGWQCPSCGGLRATHQLLHGNVAAAFELNALYMITLPLWCYWLAAVAARRFGYVNLDAIFKRPLFWVLFGITAVMFGICRNLG